MAWQVPQGAVLYYALAFGSLRDRGFDVADPTASTYETWAQDLRLLFSEDASALQAYEACDEQLSGSRDAE
ncbi:MAG TPA: hypothetical protein QGF35_00755 [Dehalococcoidia bacterium]|jgi:hypothetical protein|nr:hypothetical protein [Dehalococcoidia bacterium]